MKSTFIMTGKGNHHGRNQQSTDTKHARQQQTDRAGGILAKPCFRGATQSVAAKKATQKPQPETAQKIPDSTGLSSVQAPDPAPEPATGNAEANVRALSEKLNKINQIFNNAKQATQQNPATSNPADDDRILAAQELYNNGGRNSYQKPSHPKVSNSIGVSADRKIRTDLQTQQANPLNTAENMKLVNPDTDVSNILPDMAVQQPKKYY